MAGVEIEGLQKRFGGHDALRDIDLRIEDGEFVVLVGPSGCGKSTLLRCIAGLERPSAGRIAIGGRTMNDAPPRDRDVAMVFQSYALYPHFDVARNMGYALEVRRRPRDAVREAVARAAAILGLEPYLERRPRALSGGQRQRVAMGRAIVRAPQAFLFDEPLSNLDARLREQMRIEIGKLHRALGVTSIYVTHDQIEAMTMADRIVAMEGGRIRQVGAPLELYDRPANMFVASFIGAPAMSFVEAVARRDGSGLRIERDGLLLARPSGRFALGDGARVVLGARPEALSLALPSEGFPARVDYLERTGLSTILHLEAAGAPVRLLSLDRLAVAPGEAVHVRLDPERVLLFDPATGEAAVPSS